MSGLPRSGSSLIQNILNQNPYFYATGTSPILNIILKLKNLYSNDLIIKSTPDKNKYVQIYPVSETANFFSSNAPR